MPNVNGAAKRPAEVGSGLAGAIAALLVYFFSLDTTAVLVPLVIVLGAVPGAITYLVTLFRRGPAPGA
jgi:hypothetical protein